MILIHEQGIFDYIVVGAGSAGCVLANRLSAARATVLLIEAGGRGWNPWLHIPMGYGRLFKDSRFNWLLDTEPESELADRRIAQPRGKVLGGSSAINGLVYIRGQREDFDSWRALGNAGWGFDDVLPAFKVSEHQTRGAGPYHGVGGPLWVSDPRQTHPLCDAFIRACSQSDAPFNPDFNGPTQEGAGYFQNTARYGVRCSAAKAYLSNSNRCLKIVTDAHATQVTFNGRRAVGVQWTRGREEFTAKARAEIVVCAGSLHTPQLLQLSGVGDPHLLQRYNIPIVHALAGVGAGLQDHLQARVVVRCRNVITFNDELGSPGARLKAAMNYLLRRKGPLSVSAGYAGAFLRTRPEIDRPDVQVHFITFSTDRMGEALHRFPAFTASVCQLRPDSRGSVEIQSRNPHVPPLIRANYLSTANDRATLVAGLRRLRQILSRPPMKNYIAAEVEPGPACTSDAQLLEFCRRRASSIYHPVGTARMGDDALAVVDCRLRVHGIQGLRVADGSVMPTIVSGNTNAAIVMIGERAAQMILEDARG